MRPPRSERDMRKQGCEDHGGKLLGLIIMCSVACDLDQPIPAPRIEEWRTKKMAAVCFIVAEEAVPASE